MSEKILVTSRSALIEKYGKKGFDEIIRAVQALAEADKGRGYVTRLVFLDDQKAMRGFRGTPVTDIKSGQQHKEAIDSIYAALKPEYLVILDGPDVVPHVSLSNPAPEDDDPDVPSDLPYACDAPFVRRDPSLFTSVTRVVGRIPGIVGARRPTFLVRLLNASARFRPRPRKAYLQYFSISAQVWQKSTEKSLKAIFGKADKLLLSPPVKDSGANRYLGPLTHFINCHGDTISPDFFGQRNKSYPIALTTDGVARHAGARTVVAAECCYGAELYDPTLEAHDKPPICVSYLQRGAVGFFGSTNVAYGDAARNSAADLITRYFLIEVLAGASLGRACLQARQKFVDTEDLDKYNLKTLAQFILLGDPSLHPCAEDDRAERQITEVTDHSTARAIRRMELAAMGKAAGDSAAFAGRKMRRPSPKFTQRVLAIARQFGVRGGKLETFESSGGPLYRNAMRTEDFKPSIHVVSKTLQPKAEIVAGRKRSTPRVEAVVVHGYGNQVARAAHYVSR
jgi:hypothetical protein